MKYILLLFLLFASSLAYAQPRVSYITPDIGSANMNTYVEVYAPHDAVGSFGASDQLYLNNQGDAVRLKCLNPADTNRIIISPLIVSWQGRLISAHIFIHPSLLAPSLAPNSADWRQLQRNFRIPIVVEVAGIQSNVDTFYVVRPFDLDAAIQQFPSERVLGAGNLGVRSRRGAMIVSSASRRIILFQQGTYSVSTSDCDPNTPGNQGFLPFSFISDRVLVGSASGTTISIEGSLRHAGPGGGGGGGQFYDATIGGVNLGSNGGDGFTGGGPGGRNNSGIPLISNQYRQPGAGSGSNQVNGQTGGASLNGLPGGNTQAYESAGGGSGHPFGSSGSGWNGVNDPVGAFGAGSGHNQQSAGGGGGFATRGEDTRNNNGGNVVGNTCLVPIAGGSGGASGNPQGFGDISGDGGGGGGAIRVYAPQISTIHFSASGGNGDTETPKGGSGSGGSITLATKTILNGVTINLAGGGTNNTPKGGMGRLRFDGEEYLPTLPLPSEYGSFYQGPNSDTQTVVKRLFILRGRCNLSRINIFLKPDKGKWRLYDNFLAATNKWNRPIDLFDRAAYPQTLYFSVVSQDIPTPENNPPYVRDPDQVFSQAAANILRLKETAIIASVPEKEFARVRCKNEIVEGVVKVWNEGGENLLLSNIRFLQNNKGFSLVPPIKTTIPPDDTSFIVVRFSVPPGNKDVIFRDTLFIENNDPEIGRNPWIIPLKALRDSVEGYFVAPISGQRQRQIDFGRICLGSAKTAIIDFRNFSTIPLSSVSVLLDDNSNFSLIQLSGNSPLSVDSLLKFQISAFGKSKGLMRAKLIFRAAECLHSDTVEILAEGAQTELSFSGTGQFGLVRVGESAELAVTLHNYGTAPAIVPALTALLPPFQIVSSTPPLPGILDPGKNAVITIRYSPTAEGQDTAILTALSLLQGNSCEDTTIMLFAGRGYRANILTSKNSLNFGSLAACQHSTDSVYVINRGINTVVLPEPAIVTGMYAPFAIVRQPLVPYQLTPNDSVLYVVEFNAALAAQGINSAILEIKTADPSFPLFLLPMTGIREVFGVNLPGSVSMGQTPIPGQVQTQFDIRNSDPLQVEIAEIFSRRGASVSPSQNIVLPTGGAPIRFTVQKSVTTSGIQRDTLVVIFSKPCADTQYIALEAIGLSAELAFTNKIDLQRVYSCFTKTDSVLFSNIGAADLTLESASIQGIDAALFSIAPPINLPTILSPGSNFTQQILFSPEFSTNGVKSAKYILVATINGQQQVFSVELEGERITPFVAAPDSINMGSIEIQTSSNQIISFRNASATDIRTEAVSLRGNTSEFSIVPIPPTILPATIPPGGILEFSVQFTPSSLREYIDTIQLEISQPCTDMRLAAIRGRGKPVLRSYAELPVDNAIDPRTVGYSIPIVVYATPENELFSNVGFRAEFTVDERIFFPKSATVGALTVSTNSATRKKTIVVEAKDISFTASAAGTVVSEIIGDALLGSVEFDSLRWNGFIWTSGTNARVDSTRNGLLQSILCEEGGKRQLQDDVVPEFAIFIRPQPVTSESIVELYIQEVGEYRLSVYDMTGAAMVELHWTHSSLDAETRNITIPWTNIAPGVYAVVLYSPSKTMTETIVKTGE